MWTELRVDIETIRKELKIPEKEFRPLGLMEWQGLEEKIYQQFCHLSHPTARPTWMWTRFKQDTAWLAFACNEAAEHLHKLVPADEAMWLLLNETVNEQDKFWFYEGRVEAIQQVLSEASYTD